MTQAKLIEGGNGLAYAETTREMAVASTKMTHHIDPLSAPTAPPALALALLVVLGGVWSTHSFVVYQVIRNRREKEKTA